MRMTDKDCRGSGKGLSYFEVQQLLCIGTNLKVYSLYKYLHQTTVLLCPEKFSSIPHISQFNTQIVLLTPPENLTELNVK
jgi:hypothetical protein